MTNIEKAMQEEKAYQKERAENHNGESLIDRVREYGFKTLKAYFKAKQKYAFEHLNFSFSETTPQLGARMTLALTEHGEAGCIFGMTDQTCVFHGDEPLNEAYCIENGIEIINYNAPGGNIIIEPGDLSCGINVPLADIDATWILEHLAAILRRYEPSVNVDGNDIVAFGEKVAGSAHYQRGDSFGLLIHFSFSDRRELIENICLPETRNKQPGYITFVSREQLREDIRAWLR